MIERMHWIHEEGKVQYPYYVWCLGNLEVAMVRRPYRGEFSVPLLVHAQFGPLWESLAGLWVSAAPPAEEMDHSPSTHEPLPVES